MVVFVIFVNLLLVFKLYHDWYAKNKEKRVINHALSAAIDVSAYLIVLWVLKLNIGWLILALSYRWIFFDLLFNLINRDKWNHYGESSKIDRFMIKTGKYHILIKMIPIIIGILIIIL